MDLEASVVVPAFNESKRIDSVLAGLKETGYEVIVVDDGSADGTHQRVAEHGLECIRFERNRGKGHACRAGAARAGKDKVIFFDGDGQFDVKEIYRILQALEEADLVVGFRDFRKVPAQRRLSNWFAKSVLNRTCGSGLHDALCGFRGIRKGALNKLGLERDRYEFESEMLIKAARAGLRVKQVPVSVRYHKEAAGMPVSHSFKLTLYILKEYLRSKVGR